MLSVTQVTTSAQIAAVQELWREFRVWSESLLEPQLRELDTAFDNFEEELAGLPSPYSPPGGSLLLATHQSQPAGAIAFRPLTATAAELKHLYVRPAFRGQGIGQALVQTLLTEARRLGYRQLVLDSIVSMKAAHALYYASGFHNIDCPANFPDYLKPWIIFMECDLST